MVGPGALEPQSSTVSIPPVMMTAVNSKGHQRPLTRRFALVPRTLGSQQQTGKDRT